MFYITKTSSVTFLKRSIRSLWTSNRHILILPKNMHLLSITNTSFKVYRIVCVQYSAALYQIPVLNSACIKFGDKYSAMSILKWHVKLNLSYLQCSCRTIKPTKTITNSDTI